MGDAKLSCRLKWCYQQTKCDQCKDDAQQSRTVERVTAGDPNNKRCKRGPNIPVQKLETYLPGPINGSSLADTDKDSACRIDEGEKRRARNDYQPALAVCFHRNLFGVR